MVSTSWLAAVMDNINEGVIVAERSGAGNKVVYVNRAYLAMSGFGEEELLGSDCLLLQCAENEAEAGAELAAAVAAGRGCEVKLRQYTKDGRLFWNQLKIAAIEGDSNVSHLICISTDVTQQEYVKNVLDKVNVLYGEMSRRLEYTNETDSLTQLKNRGHLSTRGEFMLGAAKRKKLRLHAVVIDVDDFKLFNSVGGSGLGDECLIQVAQVIRYYFSRATDIAIRLCDDEFVVICIEDDDARVVGRAEALRDDVQRIKMSGARDHSLTVSIGIYSLTPEKHTTIEGMIEAAGQMVFQGTHGKRNRIVHHVENSAQHSRRYSVEQPAGTQPPRWG